VLKIPLLAWASLVSATAVAAPGNIHVEAPQVPGEIILDGFPTGEIAPATIRSVSPGEHLVELQFGCVSGSLRVEVVANTTTEAPLVLNHLGGTGTLRLRGLPRGGRVFLDSAPIDWQEEGMEVPCGAHRALVEAEGFEPWSANVVVTTGKWTMVEIDLVEQDIEERVAPTRSRPGRSGGLDEPDDLGDGLEPPEEGEPIDDLHAFDNPEHLDDLDAPRDRGLELDDTEFPDDLDSLDDEFDQDPVDFDFEEPSDSSDEEFFDMDREDRESAFIPRTNPELDSLDSEWERESRSREFSVRRAVVATGFGGLGLVGAVLAVTGANEFKQSKAEWTNLYANNSTSSDASQWWNQHVRPSQLRLVLGSSMAVVGLGGGATTFFFLREGDVSMILWEGRW
jgi:hypothetical protein